jgi:hypothetical protein
MFKSRVTGIDDGGYLMPVLTIANYRAEIPCDCHQILGVAIGTSATGIFYPCRQATGTYDIVKGDVSGSEVIDSTTTYPNSMDDKIQFVADVFSESYSAAFTRINSTPALATILDNVFRNKNYVYGDGTTWIDNDYTYVINTPYLNFSVSDGYCMMAYKAIATDKNGYPLIPDQEELKEAIYWYVNMKITYPLWRKGDVRDVVYFEAKKEWMKYKGMSYGNFMMPDESGMKALLNLWLRPMPMINEDQSFYKYIGEQQKIYNR